MRSCAAPGGLDRLQFLLERLIVLRPDLDRWRTGGRTAAKATAHWAATRRATTGEHAWAAGEHRRRPGESPEQEAHDQHDQEDLQQEAEEPAEAQHAAEEAVAEQQSADTGADQPAHQAGHEAGTRAVAMPKP